VQVVRHSDNSGIVVQEFLYELDATGRILSVIELNGRTTTWTYDTVKRLISENVSGDQSHDYSIIYEYDKVGNRVREIHSENGGRTFLYDANDRLSSIAGAAGATHYTFDGNGNLISEVAPAVSKSLKWNEQNELTEQVISEAETTIQIKFVYDAAGRRVQVERNGTIRKFVVDPVFEVPQVVAELDATGAVVSWFGFGRNRVVQIEGLETLFWAKTSIAEHVYSTI